MVPSGERPADTREMVMAHDMFRREFGLMPGLVRAVAPEDLVRMLIVADHVELVVSVLSRHQHGEDTRLWPRLLERVSEGDRPLVRVMQNQHEPLDGLIVDVAVGLGRWRGETAIANDQDHACMAVVMAAREGLAVTLELLFATLRVHLEDEERFMVSLIEEHITAAEWDEMVQAEADITPPERVALIFGMLMYEADPEVVEAIIEGMPLEVRPGIKQGAESAFADHAKRVHGTVTPPRTGVDLRRGSWMAGVGGTVARR